MLLSTAVVCKHYAGNAVVIFVLYAPCCVVRFCDHYCISLFLLVQHCTCKAWSRACCSAGGWQDTQYIPCTVLGADKGAGWTQASSIAWLGKPFAEAFVDSDYPIDMEELVDEVKQVRLNVILCTIIC